MRFCEKFKWKAFPKKHVGQAALVPMISRRLGRGGGPRRKQQQQQQTDPREPEKYHSALGQLRGGIALMKTAPLQLWF